MYIKNQRVIVYDIEVFPNVFHCTCKDTETKELVFFEISNRKVEITQLIDYFKQKDVIFCGYNNKNYDDTIINYIICYCDLLEISGYIKACQSIFNLSCTIVQSEDREKVKPWKYANYFQSFDLLTMQFSEKLRVGLKSMQVTMHYENVQEYEGEFDQYLPDSEIDEMKKYNINDVESTTVLLDKLKKDIDFRLYIEEEYGIKCLSMDGVKIGDKILEKYYCDATRINPRNLKGLGSPMDYVPLKDVILPFIQYKNPKIQDVLEDMKRQIVYTKERKSYEKKFVLSNVVYSVGVGGIHSINTPEIFLPEEGEFIGHSDVASMYPSLLIKYKWAPRHLGEKFWSTYSRIYEERLEAKHSGQKLKNTVLKLALNSVTGKMQQETSWMYDPFSVFKIRINGQLILLMLVDRLLALNCKIVQVNTDGVMYVAKKTKLKEIQEAVKEVEQLTQLTFEDDYYEAFYQYAVNDYFGVQKGYSQSKNPELIEKKGMFITDTKLGKGLTPIVIPKAVINYFLTKEPVSDFIKRQTDIREFLMGQRVDKKFKVFHGQKRVQQINRYFASDTGHFLYKIDDSGKETNLLTKSGVTILNKFDNIPIDQRNINYRYYIGEANKIIFNLKCKQLELFS